MKLAIKGMYKYVTFTSWGRGIYDQKYYQLAVLLRGIVGPITPRILF
jgi:hypothetical protein